MSVIVTCNIGGESIRLDLDSDVEGTDGRNYELWRANTYAVKEPDTLQWIDTFFQPGEVIYDIGANIGQYALYAAKKLKGQATILAFEPEALNYAKLNKNIVLNGLSGLVIPFCLAISDRLALERFYAINFTPGASLHALGRTITQGEVSFSPKNEQGMMTLSLDDLTGRFALPFPNHIKVDVDGIEDRIVSGADQTLSDPRLRTFLIEVYMHGEIAAQIKAAFFAHGFKLRNAKVIDYSPGVVQNLIFSRVPGR